MMILATNPLAFYHARKDAIDRAVLKVLEMDGISWAKKLPPLKMNFPHTSAVPRVSVSAAVRRRTIWP